MPPSSWWSRLRETRIVQALVVYLAGAWVAVQAVALVSSAFEWPGWVMRGSIVVLAAGLVATLVLVWAQSRPGAAEGEAAPRSRPLLAGAVAVALLLVGAALFVVVRDRGRSIGPDLALASAAPGIAILPFTVNDPELERWREGLVDLLATNLDGAGGLRAIDRRTVLARWRERAGESEAPDLATSLDIASSSGGRYAILGSAVSSGTSMRVVADVYDLDDRRSLGQERVEGSPDSIFGLVDQLSIAVLALILEERPGNLPSVDVASLTTTSLTALKSFLEAEALSRRSDFENAIPAYERAVEADSTFALAGYRLAQAIGWIEGLNSPRSLEFLRRAARFAERLPDRERRSLETALAFFERRPDATTRARTLTQAYPDDPGAWFLLGDILFHLPYQSLPSREEIERPFVRATRLDPSYTPAYIHLLDLAFQWADSARLVEILDRYDDLAAGSAYDARYGMAFRMAFGTPAERRAALAAIDTLSFHTASRLFGGLFRHPRFSDLQLLGVRRLAERFGEDDERYQQGALWIALGRGEIREVLEAVKSPDIPEGQKTSILGLLIDHEIELPDGLIDEVFPPGENPQAPGPGMIFRAVQAVQEGRTAEYQSALGAIEAVAQQLRASGDSASARGLEVALTAMRARAAIVQGDDEEARTLLEPLYREQGFPPAAGWLARIHAKAGRYEEAARYLETFGPTAWSAIELGAIYERLGRRDDAIEAYGWVLLAWDDADPELQPEVASARSAIARLRGLQRG